MSPMIRPEWSNVTDIRSSFPWVDEPGRFSAESTQVALSFSWDGASADRVAAESRGFESSESGAAPSCAGRDHRRSGGTSLLRVDLSDRRM